MVGGGGGDGGGVLKKSNQQLSGQFFGSLLIFRSQLWSRGVGSLVLGSLVLGSLVCRLLVLGLRNFSLEVSALIARGGVRLTLEGFRKERKNPAFDVAKSRKSRKCDFCTNSKSVFKVFAKTQKPRFAI